jgi:3-phytase
VVADDKSDHGGVAVYDLTGKLVHYQRAGKIGNIDIRDEVRLGDKTITLVGANDRSTDTIRLWALDHDHGRLSPVEARTLPTARRNYGFCLGRSPDGLHLYAFVSVEEGGTFEQYELRDVAGRLDAAKVRTVDVGSQSEGCVVDDVSGSVYVGEEDVGIWRYDVDPATGARRTAIDHVGEGHLTADVEGLTATRWPDGSGVLMASSQGDSTIAVYDLDGAHAFRTRFRVSGSGSVDGVSQTDGIDVATGAFGPNYPDGLLVVHDAENQKASGGGDEPGSNLKLVRFDQVISGRGRN